MIHPRDPLIQLDHLTKRFPAQNGWRRLLAGLREPAPPGPAAVDDVTLAIEAGEFFGLLGPNGAGKTTLIKLLSTLILPTSGSAQIAGIPLEQDQRIKRLVGLSSSDERSFYWRLSGRQNLEFFARLQGLAAGSIPERIETVLDQVELIEAASKPFQFYSSGMRQRLSIARALLPQPRILFLDEPSKGLDPIAARHLHDLLQRLRQEQALTILLTTHSLDEAERLCDRIAIMHAGRILTTGSVPELRAEISDQAGLAEHYTFQLANLSLEGAALLDARLGDRQIAHEFRGQPAATDPTPAQAELQVSVRQPGDLHDTLEAVRLSGAQAMTIEHQPVALEVIFNRYVSKASEKAQPQTAKVEPVTPATLPAAAAQQALDGGAAGQIGHRLRQAVGVAGAFLLRDLRQELSYRVSFLLQLTNIVFMTGVYYFISRLFGGSLVPQLSEYGMDYFTFVLVGIAFTQYFSVGLSSFAASLRQAQTTGTLEAMLSTPTSLYAVILYSSLWEFVMSTLRVMAYLGIGMLFLGVSLGGGNYPLALLILLVTIAVFSSLGILAASFVMVLKRGDPITWIFSGVSSLLGGVFYPISVMPDWLQKLARLLPITYALDAMRLALKPGVTFSQVIPSLSILLVFGCLLLPGSLLAFRYAVHRAKIEGSLSHY